MTTRLLGYLTTVMLALSAVILIIVGTDSLFRPDMHEEASFGLIAGSVLVGLAFALWRSLRKPRAAPGLWNGKGKP